MARSLLSAQATPPTCNVNTWASEHLTQRFTPHSPFFCLFFHLIFDVDAQWQSWSDPNAPFLSSIHSLWVEDLHFCDLSPMKIVFFVKRGMEAWVELAYEWKMGYGVESQMKN